MSRYTMEQIGEKLSACGLVATLVVDHVESAVPLADALLEGGLDVMELTLRTPTAIHALAEVREKRPNMIAGVGTVLTSDQVREVAVAGGDFAVSPGLNPNVVKEAIAQDIPFAPGVCTPSDIEAGIELGCRVLKFFPAEPSGGIKYLKSAAAPYSHLGIRYIPLGGLNENNMGDYLGSDLVMAVGGSWIAPRDLIRQGRWDDITSRVRQACEKIKMVRASEAGQR